MVLAFFNISGGELFIIVLVVFLIFGPDKIPEIARWMGKGINEIKRATSEIRDEIDKETGDIRNTTQKIKRELTDELKNITPDLESGPVKKPPVSNSVPMENSEPAHDPYNLDQSSDYPSAKPDEKVE